MPAGQLLKLQIVEEVQEKAEACFDYCDSYYFKDF
jgi:hypothetical protein